jgi:phytoene dehydrogenase-like protein
VPTNTYDLVVLGDDLAALVCATLCARRGMRTLVLGDDRPARYALGPHKLPIEPVLWPIGPGSPGERVLKELHAEMALRRKLRELKIPAQLVAPDLRVDLGGDRLAGELAREIGDASERWIARWQAARDTARLADPLLSSEHAYPGVGFFERREVAKLAETATDAADAWWHEAEADPYAPLWKHLAVLATRHPAPPPLAIARALGSWQDGVGVLRGDDDGLRELLLEKLTTAGGELRAGKVTEASISWGKIASVTLATGDEIGCGQVVTSLPPSEIAALLGKKAPKKLGELAEAMTVVGYRYTLNIVIDEAGIPEHMAPTVAVLEDSPFSIHLGEVDDAGRVVATIATVVESEASVGSVRAQLWKRLNDVMPFFEKHLVLAHSPFEATPPQVPGGRGSYDVPRNLPLAMPVVWKGSVGYTTGLKNLTLTGDQVLPELGIEGALTAGWSAAKVTCALAGKKKDFLRDEVVGAAG